ncbi:AaceriADL076Wp [[Ashbya] aceris (nom. inval.)]|nr:AaceriADL076Wp [[Ashbya] aceris (nom. inval.)]
MSRASKITLALCTIASAATVVTVHLVQEMERDALKQGPIKDAQRTAEKRAERDADPEAARKKMFNASEHELQQELRRKYAALQPLSGEVVTQDGDVVERR